MNQRIKGEGIGEEIKEGGNEGDKKRRNRERKGERGIRDKERKEGRI